MDIYFEEKKKEEYKGIFYVKVNNDNKTFKLYSN